MNADLALPKVLVVELSSIFVYPSVDFIKDKVITLAKTGTTDLHGGLLMP